MPLRDRKAGQHLRRLREKHNLNLRDVEQITTELARTRHDPRLRVPVTRLHGIEKGIVPSIHTLYALSLAFDQEMLALVRLYLPL